MPEKWKPWVGGCLVLFALLSVVLAVVGGARENWGDAVRFTAYVSVFGLFGVGLLRGWKYSELHRVRGLVPTLLGLAVVHAVFLGFGLVRRDVTVVVPAAVFGGGFAVLARQISRDGVAARSE